MPGDLQGIGNAHGEDARIPQGQPAGGDAGSVNGLRQQRPGDGEHRRHQCLDAVELQPVQPGAVPVDEQNLHGEGHGAQQQQHIPLVDAADGGAAEQVQPHNGGNQAQQGVPPGLLAQEEPQKGDEDDIHGGEKPRLACIRIHKADLLQAAGGKQGQTADDAGAPQRRVCPALPKGLSLGEQGRGREEEHNGQKAPDCLEGKGADFVHAHALGNKGRAPDHGSARKGDYPR